MITKGDGTPIVSGGKIGVPYEEGKVLDENKQSIPIYEKQHLEKLGKNYDEVKKNLPKSIKLVKIADGRTNSGYRYVTPFKITESKITTIGAAENSATPIIRHNVETKVIPLDVLRIRMMTDPYNFTIRRQFTDAAFQDPTIQPSLGKRNNAFFTNDFYLDLELKSMTNPMTGVPYTPEESEGAVSVYRQQYLGYLMQLEAWRKLPTIEMLEKMRRCLISNIVQGRSLTLITPKPADLGPGEMPISLRVITWENTGQVYVDTIYWLIVGVRLFFINKDMASPDEMIYITNKNWGLRWLSDFYGASDFEPFLQLSRTNRMVMNYYLTKAVENSITSKVIVSTDVQGDQATRQAQINAITNAIVQQGTDVIGLESSRTTAIAVPITTDSTMLDLVTKLMDDRLIAGMGATRLQVGRTEGLNRDTATIMEVQNIRDVRTPDEKLVAGAYETQLLLPLLAKLANVDPESLPIRVVIKRIEPVDEATDPNLEKKLAEVKGASQGESKGGLVQSDAGGKGDMEGTKSFGASRSWNSIIQEREKFLSSKRLGRNQIAKILVDEFSFLTLGASAENAESKEGNDDDSESEYEEASIEDVKAWSSIPNWLMMFHYINPNNWTDRDDYEYVAKNARDWSKLSDDQQLLLIRAFYFRNPGQDVEELLQQYGFETPSDGDSEYCWTVMTPSMKEHVIAPLPQDWSHEMVQKPYKELDDKEKAIADRVYDWRHTPHDAENLKDIQPVPDYVEEK